MSFGALLPISNKADWSGAIRVLNADTGEPLDTTGISDIKIELEDPRTGNPVLTGSITTGEVVPQDELTGMYTFYFPASRTNVLNQQAFNFAGLVFKDGFTPQLFAVRINGYDGIVGQ